MPRRLTGWVHGLVDPDTGTARSFGPDDDVPGWAAEQITNPAAWSGKASRRASSAAPAGVSAEDLQAEYQRGFQDGEASQGEVHRQWLDGLLAQAGVATREELDGVIRAGVAAIGASDGTTPEPPPPAPEMPKRNGSQEEWAAYAIAVGADPDEARQATRDDLIDRYGG